MNRQILFKAKTTKKQNRRHAFDNVWVVGDLIRSGEKYYIHGVVNKANVVGELEKIIIVHEVFPDTICRYTGLTDNSGNKIWENDIVRYTFDYPSETATKNGLKERISSVFWSEWRGSWSVYADERKCKGINNDLFKYVRNGNTVEIIGNIFDNPELLEAE